MMSLTLRHSLVYALAFVAVIGIAAAALSRSFTHAIAAVESLIPIVAVVLVIYWGVRRLAGR
jgi:hypothetical protein